MEVVFLFGEIIFVPKYPWKALSFLLLHLFLLWSVSRPKWQPVVMLPTADTTTTGPAPAARASAIVVSVAALQSPLTLAWVTSSPQFTDHLLSLVYRQTSQSDSDSGHRWHPLKIRAQAARTFLPQYVCRQASTPPAWCISHVFSQVSGTGTPTGRVWYLHIKTAYTSCFKGKM